MRLFLQEAGREYDLNRDLTPYRSLTPALKARFQGVCAYCGLPPAKWVEEHLVPMNRASVGLHSWGNVVPACKGCNDLKASGPWAEQPLLTPGRRTVIADYVEEYRYEPDVAELRLVLEKLYQLADSQTRALVSFGLVASRPYIAGLHARPLVVDASEGPLDHDGGPTLQR